MINPSKLEGLSYLQLSTKKWIFLNTFFVFFTMLGNMSLMFDPGDTFIDGIIIQS